MPAISSLKSMRSSEMPGAELRTATAVSLVEEDTAQVVDEVKSGVRRQSVPPVRAVEREEGVDQLPVALARGSLRDVVRLHIDDDLVASKRLIGRGTVERGIAGTTKNSSPFASLTPRSPVAIPRRDLGEGGGGHAQPLARRFDSAGGEPSRASSRRR